MKTAVMSKSGRLTVPADARSALGLDEETEFEVEVDGDSLILRPVVVLRRGDAWAYTTEHRELLERAHADSRSGRVHQLTERDLGDLGTPER